MENKYKNTKTEDIIKDFTLYLDKINAFNKAINLIYFDQATVAPEDGDLSWAKTISIISAEKFNMSISDEMKEFIEILSERIEELSNINIAILKKCKKDYDSFAEIPVEEYKEFTELASISEKKWQKARENNDFSLFAPYLQKIIDYKKKFINYRGYEKYPYNTLLDDFEMGVTVDDIDKAFQKLKDVILPLIQKIAKSKVEIDTNFAYGKNKFSVDEQKKLSEQLMEALNYKRENGYLGESAHPFSTDFGKHDVRITTHYDTDSVFSSMYSVIHEIGHAKYEQNISDDITDTIIGSGVSMGIHESQSRFYENIIGRSESFWNLIYGEFNNCFSDKLGHISPKELYLASNKVSKSLIRIEADELTYSIHIIIRYEIEKMIFNNEIDVNEIPEIWNNKYEEYLGVRPKTDSEGVLQDIHWSDGSFGYFPSYAIGNLYGLQFKHAMSKEFDIEKAIYSGDIIKIENWLKEHVHKFGSLLTPKEIIFNATGEELNGEYFTDYLVEKYSKIYNL